MLRKFKILIILFPLLLAGISSFAQDDNYSNYLLQRLGEFKKGHTHSNSKIAADSDHRNCVTLLLKEARENYSKLNNEAKTTFKTLLTTRVSFSGTEVKYTNGPFVYHYTLSGIDGVPNTDVNSNTVPDYVDDMVTTFNAVYQKEITNLGYYMGPSDLTNNDGDDNGGDGKYDIYIVNIEDEEGMEGVYGYASGVGSLVDNPNSTQKETEALPSFMVMNNDYSWVKGITQLKAIQVTAAHEFFHSIQMGICYNSSSFFMESTAAWMEDIVYPGIDDNLQYIRSNFNNPDVALDIEDDTYWYGAWTFWRYLSDHYTADIVKKVWIRAIDEYEHDAFENELVARGSSFEAAVINWQIANQLMTSNTVFNPFTYVRASDYGNYLFSYYSRSNVKKEKTYAYTGNSITHSSEANGNSKLLKLAADYFTINSSINFSVSLNPTVLSEDLDLYIVKLNTGNNKFEIVHAIKSGGSYIANVSDANLYNSFTVMVSRYDVNETNGASAQYSFTIGSLITGIEEPLVDSSRIYPNPATSEFAVEYASTKASSVEVFDYSGKSIYSADLETQYNGKHVINSSNWPAGMYILTMKDGKGVIARNKIAVVK